MTDMLDIDAETWKVIVSMAKSGNAKDAVLDLQSIAERYPGSGGLAMLTLVGHAAHLLSRLAEANGMSVEEAARQQAEVLDFTRLTHDLEED